MRLLRVMISRVILDIYGLKVLEAVAREVVARIWTCKLQVVRRESGQLSISSAFIWAISLLVYVVGARVGFVTVMVTVEGIAVILKGVVGIGGLAMMSVGVRT